MSAALSAGRKSTDPARENLVKDFKGILYGCLIALLNFTILGRTLSNFEKSAQQALKKSCKRPSQIKSGWSFLFRQEQNQKYAYEL